MSPSTTTQKPARRVVATYFATLDGVVEDPQWSFPYWNEETAAFKAAETGAGQEMLLGRKTYEMFAQAWPQSQDEGAAYFNGARKYVVSATRTKDIWQNAKFLSGGASKEVRALKTQPGPDLVVHGSISLARQLFADGLVDELRLLVYPVTLGKGRRLFDAGTAARFELASSHATDKGVLALVYHPKTSQEEEP
jgi:dihydrofolate reductase